MHILVIDDDDRLRLLLKQYLSKNKFKVSTCPNIEKANILLQEFSFDIIILDVMMPGKTGIDFLLEKDNNIKTPVLLLNALDQITDKIKGLKSGADDYLTKPFSIEELLLRMDAILKRTIKIDKIELDDNFIIGSYTFHHNQNLLTSSSGIKYKLTTKENDLLKLFCENINSKVDRSLALMKIWGDDSYYNARSMDVYIAKLRKYLKEDKKIDLKTIHGFGFKLLILD